MRVTTWNINSVRIRLDQVKKLVAELDPDVLCLQETKVPDELFPHKAFEALGYKHRTVHGMKGYNGVAIVSRVPFAGASTKGWCGKQDCRHAYVTLKGGVELHNIYIPAGGDVPDPKVNDKFAHKLKFVDEIASWFAKDRARKDKLIAVGDFNIAPLETDVWSHKQLLKVVSHTPIETEKLLAAQSHGEWIDVAREKFPMSEKVYTWWSYRAADWTVGDRGRRLDHIWVSRALKDKVADFRILRDARGWARPSDHVPVTAVLEV